MVDVIRRDDVKLVWVAYTYDGRLGWGHAWFKKQYCYVLGDSGFDEDDKEYGIYSLYLLEEQYLLNELARRQLCTDLVGMGHYLVDQTLVPRRKTCYTGDRFDYYDHYKTLIPETNSKDLKYLGTYRAYERNVD